MAISDENKLFTKSKGSKINLMIIKFQHYTKIKAQWCRYCCVIGEI